MDIENSIALVTGANRGLGKAYTDALLTAGAAKVYAGARDAASVAITDKRSVPVKLDVTQDKDVHAAAESCADVNLLINNAGIMLASPMLADGSEAALRAEMEVNVFGMLRMVRAFAPVLAKNGGGAVANMLSVVSWFTNPLNATYCASKHAALALTEGVRIQLKSQGTQVVAVFAGFIDTDMAAAFDRVKTSPRQVAERTLAGIREGLDEVHADERSEAVWLVVRTDPARFSAQREVRVGGARPHLLTKLSRMPARPTPAAWSSSNGHPATISANPDSSGYAMKRTRDLSDEYRPHPDALLHLVGGETVARAAICGRET